ncbi:MAG: hypothetical protein U1C18_00365, partial [Patescibacteria group bacterium]|nr:hypothetical protein [Patescibacteria group bacterium]
QELERLEALYKQADGRLESEELERLAALFEAQARGTLTAEEIRERTALMEKIKDAKKEDKEGGA